MSARRRWVAVAIAGGLLVGGLNGGLALGASETEAEKKHTQAMKHEQAMKLKHEQEAASHGAAMSAASLTG